MLKTQTFSIYAKKIEMYQIEIQAGFWRLYILYIDIDILYIDLETTFFSL